MQSQAGVRSRARQRFRARGWWHGVAAAVFAGALAACGAGADASHDAPVFAAGDIEVHAPRIPEPIGDRPAALYFHIRNRGGAADSLVEVATEAAGRAEIHRQVRSGGMMMMEEIPGIEVPAGGTVELAPGGYHVMLKELRGPLAVGDTVPVTLRFRSAGAVEAEAVVVRYADLEQGGEADHDRH